MNKTLLASQIQKIQVSIWTSWITLIILHSFPGASNSIPLQSVTSVAPRVDVNFPLVHFKQVDDPFNDWYSPIAQIEQGTTRVFEYVPGWQMSKIKIKDMLV